MPETRVIPTARSADLVTFKVLVEGEELSSVNQVLSITVQKEINRIPWASNGDAIDKLYSAGVATWFYVS